MSVSELNKRKVRQFFEEVLNEGRLELIDELVARDFIGRLTCVSSTVRGPDGVYRFVLHRRIRCPDLYVKIEDQIAEEDRVVTRWRATVRTPHARVTETSNGPAPRCAGITIIRLLGGKQVDAHTQCTEPHPEDRKTQERHADDPKTDDPHADDRKTHSPPIIVP